MLSADLEHFKRGKPDPFLWYQEIIEIMMTRFKFIAIIILAFVVACQSPVDLSQPPEIRYGEDMCTECGMIISEPRFASAYYTVDGDARRFDDIGGMASHHTGLQEDVAQFWVHDYDTEEWIIADQAFFVMSDHLHTPMDFGVVAFSDQERAQKLASEINAMVMTFEGLMESFNDRIASHEHSDS
jgi:copper chaperone NosL